MSHSIRLAFFRVPIIIALLAIAANAQESSPERAASLRAQLVDVQAKQGEKVKKEELQPGDLVFFATGKKRKAITHVGIVTEVKSSDNVKFIHASTSLGVVETNLYSDYFIKRFRGARRIIR